MGCVSSTEVITDPVTGETKTKKKLGGAPPGMRGQHHAPYQPPASAFQNGKATAHFVSYGGGNALTLMQPDGTTAPQHGGPASQFVKVTLPDGVEAGQKIKVRAPDGRLNEIIIPSGFGPGSTFTVEFAPESAAPPPPPVKEEPEIPVHAASQLDNKLPPEPYAPTATALAPPPAASHADDGFATGFNNPNWTPQPANDTSNYPTAQATAVGPYATAKPY